MSDLAKRFMDHSGKDEYGNLVLLFEDKKIKMAFGEDGEPLLSCKDLSLACGVSANKYEKMGFRGEFVPITHHAKNRSVVSKYATIKSMVSFVSRRKTTETFKLRDFLVSIIGNDMASSLIDAEFPVARNVEFKAIPGVPRGCVGSDGSVWSSARGGWKQLRQAFDKDGYLCVSLKPEDYKAGRGTPVHKFVLLAFHGEPSDIQMACHNNGIKTDNRPSNLRWGTASENAKDTEDHGGLYRGEICMLAKLNEDDVRNIRRLWSEGASLSELARTMDVTVSTISSICKMKTWRHVV